MSRGHTSLLVAADTAVHRLPAHPKLVATFAFVVVVVATPREWFAAFAGYAALLAVVAALARVPLRRLARGWLLETPFVLFALALPFVATGERVDVVGVALAVDGLWGAWNILAKATLGVTASTLLAATTAPRALLVGLSRLRLPTLVVAIMSFMFRYADLLTDAARRMRIARESRGWTGRDLRSLPTLARTAGALFLRAYERGERVHLAMLSRGWTGALYAPGGAASGREWGSAAVLPLAAAVVALAVWGTR